MNSDLFTQLLSQGFGVLVAGFLLLRLEATLKELTRQMERNTRATLLGTLNDPASTAAEKGAAQAMIAEPKNGGGA